MDRTGIYTFLTSLLNEIEIDETLFESFLDVAQMRVEDLRPWVYLRAEDKTQTVPAGTSFTTQFTLPATFKEFYSETPLYLLDSNNNPLPLSEVPYGERYQYRNTNGKFCVDYSTGKIYLLGSFNQSYTLLITFIKVATLISAAAANLWVFPTRFSKILGLMIAEMWKKGIDYDVFSDAQASQQGQQAMAIFDLMTRWDSRLQQSMTRGIDPFGIDIGQSNIANGSHII